MKNTARNRFIACAVSGYTLAALVWILLSDRLLTVFNDSKAMIWLSTAKGIFFVITTATLLFLALRSVPPAEPNARGKDILESLATVITPGRWSRWIVYAFSIVLSLATLLVRTCLAVPFTNRPLLILFMFPIILSAMLGGLGPGLLATALSALGVNFIAIPPYYSFSIDNDADAFQWLFLIINGIAVTLLSETLRRSQTRAENNRRLLDAIISGTSDAIYVKDLQGRYLLANEAAARLAGITMDRIIGRDDQALFQEPSCGQIMATDRAILASGRTMKLEERATNHDGVEMVFLETKGPVFDRDGRITGLFGISHEITERKQSEEETLQLNIELEQRVSRRTAELQAANVELESLAYALTHNLSAPLRAIKGFAQLLREEHGAKLSPEISEWLEQIRTSAKTMGELINGILSLLRCTRGELNRVTVDVSALAREHLKRLGRREPERQVMVEIESGLTVAGDPAMVETAILHLLDNAWKFTGETGDAVIRVTRGGVAGREAICIADNGAGFDMAYHGLLFQPFQRLHRLDEFPGIGIGLATVQRIIQRHGGAIEARAEVGKGALFCFTFSASEVALKQ